MSDSVPPPLDASGTLHGGLEGSIGGSASLGPEPKPKPPWWDSEWVMQARDEAINRLLDVDWPGVWEGLQNLFFRRRVREA